MTFKAFGYYDGTSDTPSIAALDIGSATGRVALVHAFLGSGASVSSISYAGEDLTPAAASDTAYNSSLQRAYAKAITATGSNGIAASTPPAGTAKTILCALFDGIASIRSVANGDTGGTAGPLSVTATTVAGDIMVVLGFDLGIYDTFTPTGGATRIPGTELYWIGAYKTAAAGTTQTTITGTFGGGNRNHEWSVFVLTPPAAAATISGDATLDGPTAAGSLSSVGPSTLSGDAALDGLAAAGALGVSAGTLTSGWLQLNNGFAHTSAPFEAFVSNKVSGDLILHKTGLTSSASATVPVCTFNDPALPAPGTLVRVTWRRTDTGAEGTELLTVQ